MQDGCSFVYHTDVPAALITVSIWNTELAVHHWAQAQPSQLTCSPHSCTNSVHQSTGSTWLRGGLVCMNNLTFELFLAMEYELHNHIGHENIAKEVAHKK